MYQEITPMGFGIAIEKGEVLFSDKSEFQTVEIFKSRAFGNILTLDGLMMTTERDEHFYHEMISHIPMMAHSNPKTVLVIGGGDGGTVREVLKHPSVESVELCEIDGMVIDASIKFLPTIACGLSDPKVKIFVEDAIEYIKDKKNCYDIILIDSTDPMGPGEGLFTEEFYTNVKEALKSGGIMAAQSESPFANTNEMKKMYPLLRKVFKNVAPYVGPIPTYPGGQWSWAFCSTDVTQDVKIDCKRASELEKNCKIYNEKMQSSVFCVPNFVKELTNG